MNTIKNFTLFLLLIIVSLNFVQAQTVSKFSKKITNYLSKDEIEKAEAFCEQQKNEQDRAECFTLMGNNALNEMEYSRAMKYYQKANNAEKQYSTLLKAIESKNQELINNHLIREVKENFVTDSESEIANKAFLPIAEMCYKKEDFKNAGYYYEKAGIKKLSIECKVLHAINSKDYITVVELTEKETIGLRNTIKVYKQAADQYFARADYKNAAKCYSKAGNKVKVELCFRKERELELKKSLTTIYTNKLDFSESPKRIEKKLNTVYAQSDSIEQIAEHYQQNTYTIEADSWFSFAKLLKKIVRESYNGSMLVKSTDKNVKDGTALITDAWLQINDIAKNKKFNLSIQEQQPLKSIVTKIEKLNKDYSLKTKNMAGKQLDNSGITNVKTFSQFPGSLEVAKKLIDDYFISINTKETPQNTAWLLFGIVKKMNAGIIKKLDELANSNQSATTKVNEQKAAFQEYYKNKTKGTFYLSNDFEPKKWSNHLFKKRLQEILN